MTLRLYTIFQKVVECGTISEAAKQLYMSQPAVTHAIIQLEEQLSLTLFERIGKRLYITESGKQLYQKTCQLMTVYEELTAQAKQLHHTPTLRIGSSITNAISLLPELCHTFQKQYEGEVKVIVQNAHDIEEKLYRNEIDLAFIEGMIMKEELIQIPLSDYENQIFCGVDAMFCENQIYELKDLVKEPWLLRERGSAIRDTFDHMVSQCDLIISPVWESVNSQVLIEAVKAGLGMSILPKQLLMQEHQCHTIKFLHVAQPMCHKNHLIYHKEKHIHKGMKDFMKYCDQQNLFLKLPQ